MSLKRNALANYVSQVYVSLIGILMVPVYLRYMGIEAYGLVGFFAMAQAWFQLLDSGLSPTFGREASKYTAGTATADNLNLLLRLLENIFGAIGLFAIALGWGAGSWVADTWLKIENLDLNEVSVCVVIVCATLGLRLVAGLYRSGLMGLERQVTASVVMVSMATLRAIVVVPVLIWISGSILMFFSFQMVVAVVEVLLLRVLLWRYMPRSNSRKFDWKAVKAPLGFGGRLAFLTWIWIISSQIDKLILSHLLPMREYGSFILATTIALGLQLCISPLQQAVLPRLIILVEQNGRDGLISLYRRTTILMAAMLSGVAGVMIAFPFQVLYAWTGDSVVAAQATDVLRWYAAGTCFMGLAGMSYTLQHAYGNLGLHVKGSIASMFFLIPAVIFSTINYGAVGAAAAWAITNLIFLFFWTPVVHGKFLPEIRTSWLIKDVIPSLILIVAVCILGQTIHWSIASRLALILILGLAMFLIFATVLFIHVETRSFVKSGLCKLNRTICKKIR